MRRVLLTAWTCAAGIIRRTRPTANAIVTSALFLPLHFVLSSDTFSSPQNATESLYTMCYNVIDGRYYTQCGHFTAMASNLKDCRRPNCLFSSQHIHPVGCRSPGCIRVMSPPAKNPIRESPTRCPDCMQRDRNGILGCH
ncbi:hypothetical protein EV122DRAFT_270574 [Schizophyllum commune]